MSLKDNKEFINLKSENRKDFYDLEVKLKKDNLIAVKTDIVDEEGYRYDLIFSIEEIEALYNFAQIAKTNK